MSDVMYFGCACPSRASELQALMVLKESDRILQRNIDIIRTNVKKLAGLISRHHKWFRWVRPTAGAIAFIKFLGPLTSAELGSLLAAEGIGIKPAYCFSQTVTPDVDFFRVGFGEKCAALALDALESFVCRHEAEWEKASSNTFDEKCEQKTTTKRRKVA